MSKTDELLRSAGTSIERSTSFRPAPAAMPSIGASARIGDPHREGLVRSSEFWLVPLDRIDHDPGQPRDGEVDKEVDEATGEQVEDPEFRRLVDSLASDGLLQPITVIYSDEPGRFKVYLGERRYRAAKKLGWEKIPAKVIASVADLDPGDLLARQGIENLIRKDLKPIQRAKLFRNLLDRHAWSYDQLGDRFGYSKGFISQALKLLELPGSLQDRIDNGQIDAVRGYHLSRIEDEATQQEVAERIVSENLNQQESAEVVRQAIEKSTPKAKAAKGRGATKPRGKPLPTERSFKAPGGSRVVVTNRKGVSASGLVEALTAALEDATARLAAEGEKAFP